MTELRIILRLRTPEDAQKLEGILNRLEWISTLEGESSEELIIWNGTALHSEEDICNLLKAFQCTDEGKAKAAREIMEDYLQISSEHLLRILDPLDEDYIFEEEEEQALAYVDEKFKRLEKRQTGGK